MQTHTEKTEHYFSKIRHQHTTENGGLTERLDVVKAKVRYASGLILWVPKDDEFPLLFLEWLAQYRPRINGLEINAEQDNDYLKIRMTGILETFNDARDFINNTKKQRYEEEYAIARGSLRGGYPTHGQGLNNTTK